MKNKFLRILLVCFLIVTMLVSGVACNTATNNDDSLNNDVIDTPTTGEDENGGYGSTDDENAKDAISDKEGYSFTVPDRIDYQGTHIRNITETDKDFIKNGKTEYIVVMSSKNTSTVTEIKADFLLLFKKATGIALSLKIDTDVENDWTVEKKYIVIGETVLTEKADIDESEYSIENIKTEGVRIITKGNTYFLLGGDQYGVCNAMYDFLTIYFNFDAYHRSGISIDTGVTDLKFKNIDVKDVPDVDLYSGDYNQYGWTISPQPWDRYALGLDTYEKEVPVANHRMRQHGANNKYLPIYKEFKPVGTYKTIHNVIQLITKQLTFEVPEDIWQYREQVGFHNTDPVIKSHEKMYPENGGNQFCFSAHGDEELLHDMVDLCAAKIIYSLMQFKPDKNPQICYATITIDDNWDHCSCSACVADMEKYASSGQVIRFINRVGNIVGKWLEIQKAEDAQFHDCYREDFKILMYAYHRDAEPPVNAVTNPDGSITYVPKDPSVVFNEYTAIWNVSSGETAHTGIYDSLQGTGLTYLFPGWKAVEGPKGGQIYWYNSPVVYCRDYAYDELTQYNNEFWQLMAYYGYRDVFMDHFSGAATSGWKDLFNYLCGKLRWDSHADADTLTKDFMKGMYYEAADIMYDNYEDMRLYYVNLRAKAKDPSRHPLISSSDNYPYPVLENWINNFELAKQKIAHYEETNPDLYITLKTRIEVEEVGEVIKAVSFYGSNSSRPYSQTKYNEYRNLISNLAAISPNLQWQGKKIMEYIGG